MSDWLTYAREALADPWIMALGTAIGAVFAAKIIDFTTTRVLLRLTRKTDTDLDDRIIRLLHRPVQLSVVLIGLHIAVGIPDLPPGLVWTLRALFKTAAILIWTVSGLKICSTLLAGLGRLADRVTWIESRTVPLFDNLAKMIIVGAALYGLLMGWELDVTPWLASAGITGIAIGFAAKDSLANLFGGLFVIADSPYKIGDFINLASGERGQVVKIGLRSTRLLTRDDVEVTVPNAQIANSTIVNESGGPYQKTRVTICAGVAYGSDVDRVEEVLLEAARSVDLVLDDPEPRIRFTEMGDSALIFRVLCWIEKPVLKGRCVHQLNGAVYKALGAAGIEIPFPQRVVHLRQPLSR